MSYQQESVKGILILDNLNEKMYKYRLEEKQWTTEIFYKNKYFTIFYYGMFEADKFLYVVNSEGILNTSPGRGFYKFPSFEKRSKTFKTYKFKKQILVFSHSHSREIKSNIFDLTQKKWKRLNIKLNRSFFMLLNT